jgi:hypothetical protein
VIADHKMYLSAFRWLKYVFEARSEACVSSEKRCQYDYRVRSMARTRLHLVHIDRRLAYLQGRLSLEAAT